MLRTMQCQAIELISCQQNQSPSRTELVASKSIDDRLRVNLLVLALHCHGWLLRDGGQLGFWGDHHVMITSMEYSIPLSVI